MLKEMKRYAGLMLAALISCSAIVFTSCSDDDDESGSSANNSYLNGNYSFTFNGETYYYGYRSDDYGFTVDYISAYVCDLSVNSYLGASAEGVFWFSCCGYTDYDDLLSWNLKDGDKQVDFDIMFEGISDVKALKKGQELSFATLYNSSGNNVSLYASELVISSEGETINEWHPIKPSDGRVTVEHVITYDDDDAFYVVLNFDNVTYKASSFIDDWDKDAVIDGQIVFYGDDNFTY